MRTPIGEAGPYSVIGGANIKQLEMAMLWVLNLSDGSFSLLDIAERSGLAFYMINDAANMLLRHDLLAPIQVNGSVASRPV